MTSRIMKYLVFIGFLLLNLQYNISAQNVGKISGVITDEETGEPLIGCTVVLQGTRLGAITDLDGNYFVLNIPAGKYDLLVSMIGYSKKIQTEVIVNSGRTTIASFVLKSTAIEQEVITVKATRPDVEPEKTSTSVIIRADEVQQIAGMRNIGNVIGLAADVMDGHFRGGRSNEELYVLQGMGITNPLDNSRAITPIMSAVEEVEVVTSGFGAQYGNAQSGVINISMKEGKSDKWRSFAEARMRPPKRKHFGPSVYDIGANRYLQTYSNIAEWRKHYATVIQSQLGQDSLLKIQAAMLSWEQARRGINQTYGNQIDYSVEMSTGGPINENMRMFVAFSNNTDYLTFPGERPNVSNQLMGNIVADLGGTASLRISGAYAQSKTTSMNVDNYRGFFWNSILGLSTGIRSNVQLGVRFTQALSQRTFYEIKLNMLSLNNRSGSGVYAPDSLLNTVGVPTGNWIGKLNPQPDNFSEGPSGGGVRDQKTKTYSLDASITSQITLSHSLNAGIQANIYDINVDQWGSRSITGTIPPSFQGYKARPREASIYVQDKMEFQGMIANVGLRCDFWDRNIDYHADPFINQTIDTGKVKSTILGRLQPRVGISFPVSVNTVFHLNYGTFMQRPSFQYSYQYTPGRAAPGSGTFGSPTLKPEVSYMYDVGITQGLGDGFTFDASGYYKNVKDQIESAIYYYDYSYTPEGVPIPGPTYTTYINRDYADIRGFRLAISKRQGNLTGNINYQYSVATGKSAAVGNATPIIGINSEDTKNIPKKDILLNYDRPHNLIINIGYRTDENWGFKIGDFYPFGDVILAVSSFAKSGRPYTYNPTASTSSGSSATMNKRMPAEYNTNIKITKKIKDFFGSSASIYFEVFNLFDNKILNYDYITNLGAAYLTDYHTKPLDALDGILYNDGIIKGNMEYGFDHSFIVYDNDPRSFTLGITVDF
ncbi:MAG: carboxypeptidase-like regulatory domain-containing protein [Ignavibacteria bacterium]|nr:carboxypeptidase-like regulatory domain-containing protein [Ignavibacteria bacterium]